MLRTPGNFNTEVGLPLTILSARGDEAFWVLEMAMRGRGEIALLARIARPHIGVITNVAGAHLERLGSIEEVAHAKGELFAGLVPRARRQRGVAILPAGDPLIEAEADAAAIPADRRVTFDGERRGDVHTLELIPAGASGSIVRYAVRRRAGRGAPAARAARTTRATAPPRWRWRWRPACRSRRRRARWRR